MRFPEKSEMNQIALGEHSGRPVHKSTCGSEWEWAWPQYALVVDLLGTIASNVPLHVRCKLHSEDRHGG